MSNKKGVSKVNRVIRKDDLVDKAVKASAEHAREEYLRLGLMVPESRGGKIVWVSPKARNRKGK